MDRQLGSPHKVLESGTRLSKQCKGYQANIGQVGDHEMGFERFLDVLK